ncbi:aldehyde dehydrogenase family protein [Rubrobacter xylanophilus]|uniref:aldehyde dehydrogenase family protein n=1 Tax=Rubrobacter xylanophilus TaxID=49319 RepID=UPI001F2D409E|nr:aldehyde dehydrogenase family protein [Rubrobacter xylanophilus]
MLENFIDGEWVEARGERVREILSPVTGEKLAEVPDASAGDVSRAARAAREAQPRWAALSAWERAEVCHAIAGLLEERKEDLARQLSLEQGKPYRSEAIPDIEETAENFRVAAEDIKRLETAVIPSQDPNKRILTFREPNGVYACITPWNFPTVIPSELIAPAIAAGNTVVAKPSEWTPISMASLVQVMADAGLPEGVVNLIYGAGEVGERLVTSPDVDCIAFVGSHRTAEKIVRAAGLRRTLIEASGNGPVIVCADADLRRAAKGAVFGGFYCSGQVCCATERVLVDRSVHEDFLQAVVEEARSWKLGDPFEEDTLVGPMNNEPTAAKMDRHLEDAVAKGANVVLGGSREEGRPTRLYYRPTVVDGVGTDTLINRDETFGPIVPLIPVSGDEEALAVANDSHLGLQAAVYTSSLKRAFRYLHNLRVGNVVINDSTDYWEALEPFGGATGTRTGWGRLGGRYSLLEMTDLKTVVLDFGSLEG